MRIDDCNGPEIPSVEEEVAQLRQGYHRARTRYRSYTGRSPPLLAALQRLAVNLYHKQSRYYNDYERHRYPAGVMARLVRPLRTRTPELRLSSLSKGRRQALHEAINDMANYACYRALLRVPEDLTEDLFRNIDLDSSIPSEADIVSLIQYRHHL